MGDFSNIEYYGTEADLQFLHQDDWLQETAIEYNVIPRKGRFWIKIIYVDAQNPFRFRIRTINHYSSLSKAEQAAQFFQRGIRRDPRGTLKINADAFHICAN